MPSAQRHYSYAPRGAPHSYATSATRATHGRGPPQMALSPSQQALYPTWNPGYDSRDRQRVANQQVHDENVALSMQEELDLAQAIANSTKTAEREAILRGWGRDTTSDRRQPSYHTPPALHSTYSNSSNSSSRSRQSRPPSEAAQGESNTSFRARRYVRHPNASPAEKLFEHDAMFTTDFRCPRCAQLIIISQVRVQRYSTSVISLLHLTCPGCFTTYCRGCALRTECPPRCTGGDRCPLNKCCQAVRAVAIFEALSDLDKAYTDQASSLSGSAPPSLSQRSEYLEVAVSRADQALSSAFDRALFHALSEINRWMPQKPYKANDVHPSVALLLSASYILEIIHHYLSHPRVGDWVIRADIYLQILILINTLAARNGLVHLVMKSRNSKHACGLHNIIWTKGKILWEDGPDEASPPLYDIIMSPTKDRPQAFLKLEESMRSSQLKERAWSLQKQIQYLQLLLVSGPDY